METTLQEKLKDRLKELREEYKVNVNDTERAILISKGKILRRLLNIPEKTVQDAVRVFGEQEGI